MGDRGGGRLEAVRRRAPWIGGVALLALLAAGVVMVGVDRVFLQTLLATFIGAALGFLVALYVDRRQRLEDAERQRERDAAGAEENRRRDAAEDDRRRTLDAEAEERAASRRAAEAKARRITLLTLLRDELGRVAGQMGESVRQNRSTPPFNRLGVVMWRSLSAAGELRWIEDPELLRALGRAYDLVGLQAALEDDWNATIRRQGGVEAATTSSFANALVKHDRDAWEAACSAYRSVNAALAAEGAPGPDGPEPFCPS